MKVNQVKCYGSVPGTRTQQNKLIQTIKDTLVVCFIVLYYSVYILVIVYMYVGLKTKDGHWLLFYSYM